MPPSKRGLRRALQGEAVLALCALLAPLAGSAQEPAGWQACTSVAESAERLACFDRWAESQRPAPAAIPAAPASGAEVAAPGGASPPTTQTAVPSEPSEPRRPGLHLTAREGCRDQSHSDLSRFWELERSSDCGVFGMRGYRPISISVVAADSVNQQPTSGNPLNNAAVPQPYGTKEMRLQLSVRTKLAKGLLTGNDPNRSDSLWFGYTQQSYWQLFNGGISRPFRSTDHEPEVIYVYPLQQAEAGRWRLRYGGLGLVHQSNGQSLPLSRSWNRLYLMAGAERGDFRLLGRVWKRTAESGGDDNPAIGDYVGRAELTAAWDANRDNQLSATLRHSLQSKGRGSLRLEWLHTLAGDGAAIPGGLKLHSQLFTGWGDSLLDFNRRRTVFSVGLSLVEW